MLAVFEMMVNLFGALLGDTSGALFGADTSLLSFGVQTQCNTTTCPGSFYTAIAVAWANIGYVTHADVLRFIHGTHFGKWAVLLYVVAAITALIGVATNSPMRNYTWFFIGPALYSFLIGTTMEVQGVNWVVANKAIPDMSEVWKNAETGLANTRLAIDGEITINGKNGPSGQYKVAMPMVFLDQLFSATANLIIEWTGIGREVAGQGNRTNLANASGKSDGPWWLLSTLKWGYLENITQTTARNPDVRDALVTFLGSECGAKFKAGIDSGAYIAATQARGATPIKSVMIRKGDEGDYQKFKEILSDTAIPTPRSLARLFKEKNQPGSFMNFSPLLKTAIESGRTQGIVCSEYLWSIIQAFRFEAGSAYYQLLRSSPNGLDQDQFVNTFLYGWDVREEADGQIATPDEQDALIKHLMLAYLFRNELLYAPQLTSIDQRFAPSEQARSYSDAYVRTYGSKAKFIELYNAAVMMPYLQGILAYFLIVSYPLATMLVILPGHYKGFLTWVSFFAWIKLWDVGFAMVQVIERSVWAMIGNHSHMGSTANVLIKTAKKVGGIGATNPTTTFVGPLQPGHLESMGAIPDVCSLGTGMVNGDCPNGGGGVDQTADHAFELLDKMLLTAANIDLDLSNGWYIYIMSALYLAVPAVTGQLVLGAKAGSAGMIKDAFSGVGQDGANAAKTGFQHQAVMAAQTNQHSLGQSAYAAAMRKATGADGKGPSLAMQSFGKTNQGMDAGLDAATYGLQSQALGNKAQVAQKNLDSYNRAAALIRAEAGAVGGIGNSLSPGNGKTPSAFSRWASAIGKSGEVLLAEGAVSVGRVADQAQVDASAKGMDLAWAKEATSQSGQGYSSYGKNLGSQAEFEAQSAAWEAKNEFASHASAMAGISGMNAGSISAGNKPQDMTGMSMSGMLDSHQAKRAEGAGGSWHGWSTTVDSAGNAGAAAGYGGEAFQGKVGTLWSDGTEYQGDAFVREPWRGSHSESSVMKASGAEIGLTEASPPASPKKEVK